MKSAVFFERDGVLNLVRTERNHQVTPLTVDEFHLNGDALRPLQMLREAGFVLICTTNQPGISRGYQSRRDLDLMHSLLRQRFPLDDIMVCPHDETDRCPCRKPQAGLLVEAGFKWHLDLERSFVISDKWQDAQSAHIAGATSILVKSPWNGTGHHDFVLANLDDAARKILSIQASPILAMHHA